MFPSSLIRPVVKEGVLSLEVLTGFVTRELIRARFESLEIEGGEAIRTLE